MKTKISDVIRARKIEKMQARNGRNLVKDAYFLADQNQEFWVGYLNANGDYEQKKLSAHNYYLAFHNSIWKSLEPNERLAALIYLERDIVENYADKFTPSKEGRFAILTNSSEDYFCKREKNNNTYYINMRLFADEYLESYAFLYALHYMHIEAKGFEVIEEFAQTKEVEPQYKQLVDNLKNRYTKTEGYEKFLLDEELTNEEAVEVCEYLSQPIERMAKSILLKVENLAFKASNASTGLGFEDLEWEDYLEDQKLLNRDEEELIERVFAKNTKELEA